MDGGDIGETEGEVKLRATTMIWVGNKPTMVTNFLGLNLGTLPQPAGTMQQPRHWCLQPKNSVRKKSNR